MKKTNFEKLINIMETSLKDEDKVGLLPASIQIQKHPIFDKENMLLPILIRHFAYWINADLAKK